MHWLGNGMREESKALADAYAAMYSAAEGSEVIEEAEELEENRFAAHMGKDTDPGAKFAKPGKGITGGKTYTMKGKDGKPLFPKAEEADLLAALQDAYSMMYEKKKDSDKCGDDTYWDKEEKKCKSKKKKSGTTVVVGRGGIYGPGYHGGGGGSNGGGDGDGDGGDSGAGDGGGGGGE